MTETLTPRGADEVREAIVWALSAKRPLELRAGGSKLGLGRPVEAETVLDLSRLTGIEQYEPAELILTAAPGTPLEEIEAALSENRQQLAFEPADYGPLFGVREGRATLGGVIACNLSGPRRIKAFAARDHFLGVKAVNGRGEAFKAGGRVAKNVTGYDLCKLLAGSYGTLAAMTEVTVKVMPAPEETRTLMILGLDDGTAIDALAEAMRTPYEVSGAAHLPVDTAARSSLGPVSGAGGPVTAVRIEGFGPSVIARVGALKDSLRRFGAIEELDRDDSRKLWRELRDATLLAVTREHILWRLSLTPSHAAEAVAQIRASVDEVLACYDWAGGLVWLSLPESEGASEALVRSAVAQAGGHALLLRAAKEIRARLPVFQPQPEALARLSAQVKESFDPNRVLNPGRMYQGV